MNPAKSHVSLSMRSLYYIFFFLSIQHLKVFRKYWFKSMWIVLFYNETMDFGAGAREVFLAKCQDNQKCCSRMQSLQSLRKGLSHRRWKIQSLISKAWSVLALKQCWLVCAPGSSPWGCWVWRKPCWKGAEQLFVAPIILAGYFYYPLNQR